MDTKATIRTRSKRKKRMATALKTYLDNFAPWNFGGQRKPSGAKKINLALQGGGSHGAFTWGVLDQFLADGRLEITGISGASAGAMNAVMFARVGFSRAAAPRSC